MRNSPLIKKKKIENRIQVTKEVEEEEILLL
jgi:hypothetical protein